MASRRWLLLIASAIFAATFATAALAHDMGAMGTMDHDDDRASSDDGGAFSPMSSRTMMMSKHMSMTDSRPATPEDTARGEVIVKTMRAHLTRYQDYKVALADGFLPYMESVPQDVYHFSSRSASLSEYMGDFDLAHPGSLLYEKQPLGGYKLVGAMYSAPPTDDPAKLDKLIPLSLSHWHAHTNICLPAGVTEDDVINGRIVPSRRTVPSSMDRGENHWMQARLGYLADPRFGFTGTIYEPSECEAAGGTFHKQIFGWMVHVYPFASEDLKVAFSTEAP